MFSNCYASLKNASNIHKITLKFHWFWVFYSVSSEERTLCYLLCNVFWKDCLSLGTAVQILLGMRSCPSLFSCHWPGHLIFEVPSPRCRLILHTHGPAVPLLEDTPLSLWLPTPAPAAQNRSPALLAAALLRRLQNNAGHAVWAATSLTIRAFQTLFSNQPFPLQNFGSHLRSHIPPDWEPTVHSSVLPHPQRPPGFAWVPSSAQHGVSSLFSRWESANLGVWWLKCLVQQPVQGGHGWALGGWPLCHVPRW